MKTVYTTQDIFSYPNGASTAICVTTNGIIKRNGDAVMGKGIALQADRMFHCAGTLANHLRKHGNHAGNLGLVTWNNRTFYLLSFPTKHDWKNNSDPVLIQRSAQELVQLCDQLGIQTCYLPPAGCGCGGLNWKNHIKPMLEKILDDRFIAIVRPNYQ